MQMFALAQSGQIEPSAICPLSGVKRTLPIDGAMSASDPNRDIGQHLLLQYEARFSPYQNARLSRYDGSSRA